MQLCFIFKIRRFIFQRSCEKTDLCKLIPPNLTPVDKILPTKSLNLLSHFIFLPAPDWHVRIVSDLIKNVNLKIHKLGSSYICDDGSN